MLNNLSLPVSGTIVDLGTGTGFPLFELAGRCGPACTVYGVDMWKNAIDRARLKKIQYGYNNVEIIEASASELPLQDNTIDLVVSNLGINNFDNPHGVFGECGRVLKPGGTLALTTNLLGHWTEFYGVFKRVLQEIGDEELLGLLKKDEQHRGDLISVTKLFTDNGFRITNTVQETMVMNFANGTAFLNHHFVKLGWITTWINLFPKEKLKTMFEALENRLNTIADAKGKLSFTVPMAYVEGTNNG